MKRKSVMGAAGLAAAILAANAASAAGQSGIAWGPRFGVGLQTVVFEDPSADGQTDPLVGFHVGVGAAGKLRGPLSAEIDVLYSREGFRGRGGHTGDLKRDMISVPALLRIGLPTRISLHLTAGAAAKIGLRCLQTNVASVGTLGCDDPVMGADWTSIDVAGVAGFGLTLPLGGRSVVTDVLLSSGFRDLNGGGFVPGTANSLSVGLSFGVFSRGGNRGVGGGS